MQRRRASPRRPAATTPHAPRSWPYEGRVVVVRRAECACPSWLVNTTDGASKRAGPLTRIFRRQTRSERRRTHTVVIEPWPWRTSLLSLLAGHLPVSDNPLPLRQSRHTCRWSTIWWGCWGPRARNARFVAQRRTHAHTHSPPGLVWPLGQQCRRERTGARKSVRDGAGWCGPDAGSRAAPGPDVALLTNAARHLLTDGPKRASLLGSMSARVGQDASQRRDIPVHGG
ncbi:hypothetical protein C1Y40_03332 [Mycobacterium talmoniae]|uniref:Uncharacterized protein n=1 Tax=Mycobacterium talmoniae TaxID=1858794 RepID=A0A2S8BIJ4_9MYCO|nr:hypothetical protein C1Y40_03332 [Mycobacterium talmoniae]